MRLRSLRIRNFRPFTSERETTFDLDHSVVLLCGGNGSGKSSFFDAIELGLTGSVGRLESYDLQPKLLVNARHPKETATVSLEASEDSRARGVNIEISPTAALIKKPGILHGHEIHLFYDTTYLLQSDIRRLVSADSSSLGEIIERLAVDENVDLLIRGLADANISRNDGSYQRVKYDIEQLDAELAQLTEKIEAQRSAIASIQDSRIALDQIAARLTDVCKALEVEVPKNALLSVEGILALARKLDTSLQKQLRAAIEGHSTAERALSLCSSLVKERTRLEPVRLEVKRKESSTQHITKQLADTRIKIGETAKQLGRQQSQLQSRGELPSLIQILSDCAELADSGVCPVCDRPFPNLAAHIRQKLSRLKNEQSALQKGINETQMRLRMLRDTESKLRESLETAEQEVASFQEELASALKRTQSFVSKYRDQAGRTMNLSEVEDYESRRLEDASKRQNRLGKLVELVSQIQSETLAAKAGLSQQQQSLESLEERAKKLQEVLRAKRAAFSRLDAFIDATQEARRNLSDRVGKLLNDFVQGRTKTAFEDLFRRIARHPYFQVTIPVSQVRYHKPEVSWVAAYQGHCYPGGAVFSQGELNACALAFFLALATTQSRHLGLLLLDDPVQSMDEIHIEEFANVLKSIKDLLAWQVIVAIHEESLFNYLKRVLYPSEPDQSLIAYRLTSIQDGPEIESEDRFEFESKVFSLTPSGSAA